MMPMIPIDEPTMRAVFDSLSSPEVVVSEESSSSPTSSPLLIAIAVSSVPSCWLVLPDTTAEASATTAVPSRVDDSVTKATDAVCVTPPSRAITFRLTVYSLRSIVSSTVKTTVNGKSPFAVMVPHSMTAESSRSWLYGSMKTSSAPPKARSSPL